MSKRKRNEDNVDEDYNLTDSSANSVTRKSTEKGKHPLSEEMEDCLALLNDLMNENSAQVFNTPVDLAIYPYYTVMCPQPCDFGLIKEMLRNNSLANPEHFAAHVRLVISNCHTFNDPNSQYYLFATKLSKKFDIMYNAMISRWKREVSENKEQNPPTTQNVEEEAILNQEIITLRTKLEATKKQIQTLKQQQSLEANNSKNSSSIIKRVRLTRPKAPLTLKQKEDLVSKISSLGEEDPEFITGLVLIVDPSNSEDPELTLNFADMDDQTILHVHKYVQDTVKALKKSKAASKRRV